MRKNTAIYFLLLLAILASCHTAAVVDSPPAATESVHLEYTASGMLVDSQIVFRLIVPASAIKGNLFKWIFDNDTTNTLWVTSDTVARRFTVPGAHWVKVLRMDSIGHALPMVQTAIVVGIPTVDLQPYKNIRVTVTGWTYRTKFQTPYDPWFILDSGIQEWSISNAIIERSTDFLGGADVKYAYSKETFTEDIFTEDEKIEVTFDDTNRSISSVVVSHNYQEDRRDREGSYHTTLHDSLDVGRLPYIRKTADTIVYGMDGPLVRNIVKKASHYYYYNLMVQGADYDPYPVVVVDSIGFDNVLHPPSVRVYLSK